MIITERFVMLNFPKTGSSFARQVVKQAHFHHPHRCGNASAGGWERPSAC